MPSRSDLRCTICFRRLGAVAWPGHTVRCFYCATPLVIPLEGPPIPGSGRLEALTDITEEDLGEARHRLTTNLPAGWEQLARREARFSVCLDALVWRVARGHASPEEASSTGEHLVQVLGADPPRTQELWSALPAAWAAELLSGDLLPSSSGCRLDATTGVHTVHRRLRVETVRDGEATTLRAALWAGGCLTILFGGAGSLASALLRHVPGCETDFRTTYEVAHHLRIDIHPELEGCRLEATHESATGETLPLEPPEVELLARISEALRPRGEGFACLKAVLGAWLTGQSFHLVTRETLEGWLSRLAPPLGGKAWMLL